MELKITRFTHEEKEVTVQGIDNGEIVVDEKIRPVVSALNEIAEIMTMNSCQGFGARHCSLTYVDFYVIEHRYEVADNLFYFLLQNKDISGYLNLTREHEEDFGYMIEDGEEVVVPNEYINFRFRVLLDDGYADKRYVKDMIEPLATSIREFNQKCMAATL